MSDLRVVNKALPLQTITAGSPAAWNSEVLDITNQLGYSFQVVTTGTVACTANIAGSNQTSNAAGFTPLMTVIPSTTQTVSSASSYIYPGTLTGFHKYLQIQLSSITGTGTVQVFYNAKST